MMENVSEMGPLRALHPREYRGVWDRGASLGDPRALWNRSVDLPSNPMEVMVPPALAATGIGAVAGAASQFGEERAEATSLDPRQALEVLRSLGFTLDMGDE
jgi:hypothetical protein